MKTMDIIINGNTYQYVTSKKINNKNYIAYEDENSIYIGEYKLEDNNNIEILPIDESLINEIRKELNI